MFEVKMLSLLKYLVSSPTTVNTQNTSVCMLFGRFSSSSIFSNKKVNVLRSAMSTPLAGSSLSVLLSACKNYRDMTGDRCLPLAAHL